MSNPISSSPTQSHIFPPLGNVIGQQPQSNSSVGIPTIKQVESVLQSLFTHTDPSIQNEANKWLLELQKHQYIVPMCLELMKVNQPFFSQFFGIQTLASKVHSDWESKWSDDFRINIKTTVFNRFLFDVDNNQLFNSKICSCIAAIMIHCIPRLWDHSITDLLTLFHSNQSSDRIKKGSLDILTLLPLEFESVILSQTRRMSIKEEFMKNSENVINSISEYLSKNLNQQLNILLLKCAKSWIRFMNSKSVLKSNLLNNLFRVIENQDTIVEGLSLIGDLINFLTYHSPLSSQQPLSNSIKIHSKDYENFDNVMVPIIRKLISLKQSYENAIKNDNLFVCRAFAETLSQIVECYAPIMTDLGNTDVQQCLSFLLEFCKFNREISELTFNAWCYLGDFAGDNEPLQKTYASLLQILIDQSSYPSDYLNNNNNSSSNSKNDKNINKNNSNNNGHHHSNLLDLDDDFEDDLLNYRNNVCDVIGACFEIIGADEFIKFINGLLKSSCKTWQSYEVVFYLFISVSPNIIEETEINNPLAQQLTSEIILFSLSLPHHPILTKTILQVLNDYNVHIKRNSDILAKSFNFILSNIQHSDTADESLKILQSFSLKYGDNLSQYIDITLTTLESLYNNLGVNQQKVFTESILQLLSFVAYNQKPNVLQRLLNPIINGIKTIISSPSPTLESVNSSSNNNNNNGQVSERILLLISKMSILESSLDFGDDLISLFKEFIGGIWNLLQEIHSLSIKSRNLDLSDQFWKVFWKIIHELGSESLFNIDSIFKYLSSTIQTFPHISSSTFNAIDLLLTQLLSTNQTFINPIQNLINTLITSALPILVENNRDSIPTIEKFFKVLVRVLELYPNIFYTSQHAVNIIELSIRFLQNLEKESLLSILSFYQQLFIKVNAHETLLKNYTKPILSNIFLGIVNDPNRTLTIHFSDLLFEWISKYSDSKMVVADCIINATWLPNETPITERERLTKLIISLSSKPKFKSLLSDISQVCNNQMTWDVFLSYEI